MNKRLLPFAVTASAWTIAVLPMVVVMFLSACALTDWIRGEATATPLPGNSIIATLPRDPDLADVREGKKMHSPCTVVADFSTPVLRKTGLTFNGRMCPDTGAPILMTATGTMVLGAQYNVSPDSPQYPKCSIWQPVVLADMYDVMSLSQLLRMGVALNTLRYGWICTAYPGFSLE